MVGFQPEEYSPHRGWRWVGHSASATNQPCLAVGGVAIGGSATGSRVSLTVGGKVVLDQVEVLSFQGKVIYFAEPVYGGSYDVTITDGTGGSAELAVLVLK